MAPGPARIFPPRARANPSRTRPLGTSRTNDFRPRTNEPRPAAAQRIAARTNSLPARPNPTTGPHRPKCTNEFPRHARTQATRAAAVGPVQPGSGNAHPNPSRPLLPPGASPRTTRPNQPHAAVAASFPPRAHARTRATVRTPPPACHRSPTRGIPRPARPRFARASGRVRPLFPRPPACLKSVTAPSTPPFEPTLPGHVATLILNVRAT